MAKGIFRKASTGATKRRQTTSSPLPDPTTPPTLPAVPEAPVGPSDEQRAAQRSIGLRRLGGRLVG